MATTDQQLRYALTIVGARGPATPCATRGFHLWCSALAADRAAAVKLCRDCPVLQSCGQQADTRKETFGVWGGRDRT